MSDIPFNYSSARSRKISKKLYLNPKLADVLFTFESNSEAVPAHRSILAAGSQEFDTLFSRMPNVVSLPTSFPILDASAESFKEFLQFFYLSEVKLTMKNIDQVSKLCKRFQLSEFTDACESTFQTSLGIDEMCRGFSIALSLGNESSIRICEEKIKENAPAILKSSNFVEMNRDSLEKVLHLVSEKCSASEIVNACMKWTKAECGRNEVEPTSLHLRAQFGRMFDQIPFCKLNAKQFSEFVTTYKGFFTRNELETLIAETISNDQSPSAPIVAFPLQTNEALTEEKLLNDEDPYRNTTSFSQMEEDRSPLLKTRFALLDMLFEKELQETKSSSRRITDEPSNDPFEAVSFLQTTEAVPLPLTEPSPLTELMNEKGEYENGKGEYLMASFARGCERFSTRFQRKMAAARMQSLAKSIINEPSIDPSVGTASNSPALEEQNVDTTLRNSHLFSRQANNLKSIERRHSTYLDWLNQYK